MRKFKTYIFDIDGTIAHTNKLIFESFRYVAKKYLSKDVTDEEIISLFGPTEEVILKEWMKDQYDTARTDYFEFYTDEHKGMVKEFEGLESIIKNISDSGKNLAVFTGKGGKSTEITLDKLGLKNYFDLIVHGDNVAEHKPSPDGLFKILNHFKNTSEEVLMIGDSPHDITAAKAAKVPVASVIWDSYAAKDIPSMNPDYIFESIPEFKEFIESTL